jgi:hypothetical protein
MAWRGARSSFVRLAALALFGGAQVAHALDKQGSAHGGEVGGSDSGFAVSGSLLGGAALYNPTYAARPDNSGLALARLAPHFDVDLIGSRLSIPIDVNLFSDRQRGGLAKLAPSELDVISGGTTTWPLGASAIELGARYERDMPIDRGNRVQSYADLRARFLFSLAAYDRRVHDWLSGGDFSGYFTLGWFAYNPTYAARPDNSGRALLRYAAHGTLAALNQHLLVGLDTVLFTDKRTNAVVPCEIDVTADLGARLDKLELHLAYERDMPIDRGGLVQHFVLLYASWAFELVPNTAAARAANPTHEPDPCDE